MDFSEIAKIRKYLSIKQSLPGRLRVQFSKELLHDTKALGLFTSEITLPKAITKTKLNMFSKSVLIQYDPKVVPQNLLEQLLYVQSDVEAETIATHINAVLYQ